MSPVFITYGAIDELHRSLGGAGGRLGFPLSPERHLTALPEGGTITYQRFEGPWAYSGEVSPEATDSGGAIYLTPTGGTCVVWCEIGERYEQLGGCGGVLGYPLSTEVSAGPSPRKSTGLAQRFTHGAIFCSRRTGAHPVQGAIGRIYERLGAAASPLGFPVSPEFGATPSRYGTIGTYQRFEGLQDYRARNITPPARCGATIYHSARRGTHVTSGPIGEEYERLHGSASRIGFPCAAESEAGQSPRNTAGRRQEFEGGTIHWSRLWGAHASWGPINELYLQVGGSGSPLGFPLTGEFTASPSPFGTVGTCQRFEGPWGYAPGATPRSVLYGAAVYCSSICGTHITCGALGERYEQLRGTVGLLGFPTSDERTVGPSPFGTSGYLQCFEGGNLYWSAAHGAVVVKGDMLAAYGDGGEETGHLGFPVSDEEAEASTSLTRVQRFEGGRLIASAGMVRVELSAGGFLPRIVSRWVSS